MSRFDPLRLVDRENDVLYRKVHPDFWDKTTNKPKPAAFQDPGKGYAGLSFFVGRLKSPVEVLEFFAKLPERKNVVGQSVIPIRAINMFEADFRIAKIPARVLTRIEAMIGAPLKFESRDGNEIDSKGHVSVIDGQKYAILFLRDALLMDKDETFENKPEAE